MASSKNYNNIPAEREPTSQTATSRENGFRDFSGGGERVMRLNQMRIIKRNQSVPSEIAERVGSYSAQPEAYEPRVALAMASEASQKVRVRVGKLPYGEQFADQVVSQTLANAEFLLTHWVWVAGVEPSDLTDSKSQPVDNVHFTETGTPFYNPAYDSTKPRDGADWWPDYYLPWVQDYSPVDDNNDGTPDWYRSSTHAVWDWKSYSPSNTPSPTSWTKYFDGSPSKNP
ncbi:MAG: hypothetical protein WC974_02895 [Thermoplasmata archaeon]